MTDDPSPPLPKHPDDAIPELLDAYGARIFDLGLHLCKNREDAQDVVQETFLRAYRAWPQFEAKSSPLTWLYTIAVRVCRRLHRRRAGEPAHIESLSELMPADEEGALEGTFGEEGPLDALLREETRAVVQKAITGVPVTFRLPLVLKDIGGLSVSQVARVLGVKEATVKTRLHRARLHVARDLSRALPADERLGSDHARQVCLDLLRGKQHALDNDVIFPVDPDTLCDRCRTIFAALQLGRDACAQIAGGRLPERLRRVVLNEIDKAPPSGRARQ